jgi:hypothetical protein
MFGDDPLNPLANITHRFPTFFFKGRNGGAILGASRNRSSLR